MGMVTIKRKSGEGIIITAPDNTEIYVRYVRKDGNSMLCIAAPPEYKISKEQIEGVH